ncbi:peritrophin-44 [Scaptodrosophila lebanonensis]|uniref:Peritrophin-44 n=1 Tax=Drosophila lebanonensis TaxID=7225 RepID=A0A6J2TCD1_DROLE|nr:peritrophin-44 [Scaptodrosophila lebanonensis]
MKQAFALLALVWAVGLATRAQSINPIEDFERLNDSDMCALLPQDTSFLRPNTCNSWVRCGSISGHFEEGSCATGLYYNKELGRCSQAENMHCPYTETAESTHPCAVENDGTFLPDPSNCRGYILCKSHMEVFATCPNNLVFHPTTHSCVYPDQYKCPAVESKTSSPACRALPNNTRLADDKLCSKYYICTNEVLYEQECNASMAYDVAKGRCVLLSEVQCYETAELPPPENTFCLDNSTGQPRVGYFEDDESCSHYYICASLANGRHDTNPQHLECPIGQFFDIEKLSCRDRLNVKCLKDRCVGTSLNFVNVAGDCQSYARCSNGVTVGTSRCPTDYYFDEYSQGCTPTNFNYPACAA